jgi:hypothetical protein
MRRGGSRGLRAGVAAAVAGGVAALALAAGGGAGGTPTAAAVEGTWTVTMGDAPKPPRGARRKVIVPNVVGLDHQLAQDTMQAAGLLRLTEQDATGEDRLLLWDRNWTVVDQWPLPGARVARSQVVVLMSVKDEELGLAGNPLDWPTIPRTLSRRAP